MYMCHRGCRVQRLKGITETPPKVTYTSRSTSEVLLLTAFGPKLQNDLEVCVPAPVRTAGTAKLLV